MLALIRNRWISYIQSPKSTVSRYETLMLRSSPKRFGYVDTPWSYIRSYALGYSVWSLRTGLGSLLAVRRALEALQRRLRPTAAATSKNRDERGDFPFSLRSCFPARKIVLIEGRKRNFRVANPLPYTWQIEPMGNGTCIFSGANNPVTSTS